ncbi:peptidyl-glycine alpha-amidating monooxygenase A-like [Sycon ciliatum]|uniref:peptidyl-glycine alpha-amidating monooxygenase A-like n=1 Tax=Sycon ciliatum TaxID=27933 RepID=UPI0031F714F3
MRSRFLCVALTICFCCTVLRLTDASWDGDSLWGTAAETTLHLQMPHIRPMKDDDSVCQSIELPASDSYIVGFDLVGARQAVDHMLVFACNEPFVMGVWHDCTHVCTSGRRVMFSWGAGAPTIHLPQGVGLPVGPSTASRHLVLRVHYSNADSVPLAGAGDDSGVAVHLTRQRPQYLSSIYLLVSNTGDIPAGQSEYNRDISCRYTGDVPLHPIAFRVHAHSHGQQVSAFKVDRTGSWSLLGTRDPRQPQAFYPVQDTSVVVQPGDVIAARCRYNTSDETADLAIGMTRDAEMCNFYLMFYARADSVDRLPKSCSGRLDALDYSTMPRLQLSGSPRTESTDAAVAIVETSSMPETVMEVAKTTPPTEHRATTIAQPARTHPKVVTPGPPETEAHVPPTRHQPPAAPVVMPVTAAPSTVPPQPKTDPPAPAAAAEPSTPPPAAVPPQPEPPTPVPTAPTAPKTQPPVAASPQPEVNPPAPATIARRPPAAALPQPEVNPPAPASAVPKTQPAAATPPKPDVRPPAKERPQEIATQNIAVTTTNAQSLNATAEYVKILGNRAVVIFLVVLAMSFGGLLSGAVVRHYQMMKRRNVWRDRFNGGGSKKLLIDPTRSNNGTHRGSHFSSSNPVSFHQIVPPMSSDSDSDGDI